MTVIALESPRSTRDVVRLHFLQAQLLLVRPLFMIALGFVVAAVITAVFWRIGVTPGSEEWVDSSRGNPAMTWALPGLLGYVGVQMVSLTFPLALTLGTTRRAFTFGTLLTQVVIASYVTAVLSILLFIELATGHWFLELYVVDVTVLGGGDHFRLAAIVFLGTLLILSMGAGFAAAWVRFGTVGPIALAAGTVVSLGLIALAIAPVVIASTFEPWWLVAAAVTMIALSAAAQYLCLLRASVR